MSQNIDVLVHEVGPRDGLQSIQTIFPTEAKMEWIRREAEAGVPQIQVGSFVPPKNLPQMADSADVVRQSRDIPNKPQQQFLLNFYYLPDGTFYYRRYYMVYVRELLLYYYLSP